MKPRRSASVSTSTVYSDTIIHLITMPLTSAHISTTMTSWRSRVEEEKSACRSTPPRSHQCETGFPDQPNSQGPASVEKENNFKNKNKHSMHYSISAEALINRVEKEALEKTHVHTHLHERCSHKRLPLPKHAQTTPRMRKKAPTDT